MPSVPRCRSTLIRAARHGPPSPAIPSQPFLTFSESCHEIKMADEIEASSSVVRLVAFAYNTSKSLYDAVAGFNSEQITVQGVQSDLSSLVTTLEQIREHIQRSEDDTIFEPLRQPVTYCTLTCQELQEMLDACTRQKRNSQDTIREWLDMRCRGKSFSDIRLRLASNRSALSIIFASVKVYIPALYP